MPTALPPPTTGAITVEIRARGNGRDADGVDVRLVTKVLTAQEGSTVRFDALPPGPYVVRLSGVAEQCVANADSLVATVRAGQTEALSVDEACIGAIAYVGTEPGSTEYQIRYLGEDGRTISLTSGAGRKIIEDWSPDGTRLLFTSDASGASHVYSVKLDGTDLNQLTTSGGYETHPRWSPDGARIAYMQIDSLAGRGRIWIGVVNSDGTNPRVLVDRTASEWDPVWSRDGSRLYFTCNRFGFRQDLCTAAPDGSGLRRVAFATLGGVASSCAGGCFDVPQGWVVSPDGGWIVFSAANPASGGRLELWVGALDESTAYPLATGRDAGSPRWSPTGDQLLFMTFASGGSVDHTMATAKRDGTGYREIGRYSDREGPGDWSSDGASVVFVSRRSGQYSLWVANPDGTSRRELSAGGFPIDARWNPKARPGPL